MFNDYLDFEYPIIELENKLDSLQSSVESTSLSIKEEVFSLQKKIKSLYQSTFSNLDPWQVVQLARHPQRPHTLDLIELVFQDFELLSGDRFSAEDEALVGGIATFQGRPVMIVGQEKGRDVKDRVKRNFGMPQPQGFRKSKRLFEMAEKFSLPLITLIDSPGAYAGVSAELNNQSEAIASNILSLCNLKTPIITVVIGEAMSGGAMAVGVGDHCAMLEYSIYAVISPEGCASILWKDAKYAQTAADIMQVSARQLMSNKLIDAIISEPLGGAHRDYVQTASYISTHLSKILPTLEELDMDILQQKRYDKWMLHQLS